ncbi:MAG: alpha/beta hydrolase, partial [Burkholderiales bacterium]
VREMTHLSGLVTQRLDLLEKLQRLKLPVLIVHGAEDDLVPPDMARRLYEAARGPKRLLLVEGAGHRWVAFRARDAIFALLRELTSQSAVPEHPGL